MFNVNLSICKDEFFSQTFLSFEFFSCGKDQTLLIYESFNIIFHMRRSSLQNINPDFGYNEHSNLLSAILFWLFVLLRMFYTFMLSEDDLLMILFLLLQSSQVVLPWSNWNVCLYISFWFQQYLCNQESRWYAVYGKSHIPDTGLIGDLGAWERKYILSFVDSGGCLK